MTRTIAADLYRHERLTGWKGLLKGLMIPGFRYMYLLRKAASHPKKSFSGIFYRLFLRRYSYKYGFQIPVDTQIGEGFYIGHFGTIVINPNAKIGEGCNVAHGVTIGQANRGRLEGCPIIGNRVWIGTNAVIVGKIIVGDNVLIAPNAFVNFDVPGNTMVIGNPGTIVKKVDPTAGYIENILD
jgi:serine O-acetyltransferase